jgi:NAD-dependent dihydropyrimidine dehydrogenase PreA subunit
MTAVAAVTERCQGCGACLLTCPERAIRPGHAVPAGQAVRPVRRPGSLAVLAARCTGCGECAEVCPVDAIDLIAVPGVVPEGMADVLGVTSERPVVISEGAAEW